MNDSAATPDARVRSAISHWAARFVANGVVLTDFEEVTASVQSWNDWCGAWSDRAAVHEQLGRTALDEKRFVSAGEHLQRAGVYYHFAAFLFVHDIPQMKAAHMKAVECRRTALPHLRPAGERVAIPYQGKELYGILRKPLGSDRPPVVVMAMGLDFDQGGMRRVRAAVSGARYGDARVRRAGPGRRAVRLCHSGRLRGGGGGRDRLAADAPRHRHRPHRHVGREPRRLLRAARHRVREAHQGLYRAGRSVRMVRGVGRPAGAHARGVPRSQPLRDAGATRGTMAPACRCQGWRRASPVRSSS